MLFLILKLSSLPVAVAQPENQWRSKGASGSTRPGAQALGAQQHTFCSHFKRVFKLKFRPTYA